MGKIDISWKSTPSMYGPVFTDLPDVYNVHYMYVHRRDLIIFFSQCPKTVQRIDIRAVGTGLKTLWPNVSKA